MINILFLLSHTEKGGGEVMVYNLIKNIDRNQFSLFLGHVDFRKGTFIHEFRKLGVEPVDFHASHLHNLLVTLVVVWRIARFIKDNNIDVVFTSGPHNHIYAILAKRITSVKIVDHVGNYYEYPLKANPLIVRLALKLRADYYLPVSFDCSKALEKLVPSYIPRKVIYLGVDKDFISAESNVHQIRQRLGLHEKDKLISVIARLQRWKGQDVFLRAAYLIAKAHPEARFCVVGGTLFGLEENYPDELRHLIDSLGLTNRCWLMGHQENVRDWILASDIIVHASRNHEPGALLVIEAMSLGKPVVATSCGAPVELIEDRSTGILCKPNSEQDLASKIMELLDDENLANNIGKAAKTTALKRFTAERMADEVEEVLKSVL